MNNQYNTVDDPNSEQSKKKFAEDLFVVQLELCAKENRHSDAMKLMQLAKEEILANIENDLKRLRENAISQFMTHMAQYDIDKSQQHIQMEKMIYERLKQLEKDFANLRKFLDAEINYINNQIAWISKDYSENVSKITNNIMSVLDKLPIHEIPHNNNTEKFDLKGYVKRHLQNVCDQLKSDEYSPLNLKDDTYNTVIGLHAQIMKQLKFENPTVEKQTSERLSLALQAIGKSVQSEIVSQPQLVNKCQSEHLAIQKLKEKRDKLVSIRADVAQREEALEKAQEIPMLNANVAPFQSIIKEAGAELVAAEEGVNESLSDYEDMLKGIDLQEESPSASAEISKDFKH